MARLIILVLIGSLAAMALGQEQYVPPEHHDTTSVPPKPTDPPTTSTTPKSTSSATTSSTTSATKSTSKTTPTTSTPSTPSTHTPTTKSTEKPTTPTTPTPKPTPPTPAPVPPKPVDPKLGSWQLNYANTNDSCVLLEFALQIEVPYNTTNNKIFTAPVNVPPNALVSGSCQKDNDQQSVVLAWKNENNVTDEISLTFVKNATSKVYSLIDIQASLMVDNKDFPGSINETQVILHHTHDEFKTGLTHSYKCAKKQELSLTDKNTNKTRGSIAVSNLQFQVFTNSTNQHFTDVEDCAPADTPDVVPIAVGCALAALVIIVLIAYLIGRRRGQARGYLSM